VADLKRWAKKTMIRISVFSVLALLAGCSTSAPRLTPPVTHRVTISPFVWDFTLPNGWQAGYGTTKSKISFRDSPKDEEGYALPNGAYAKGIGSYFYGVRGDFRDWDMYISFEALKFKEPIHSEEDLAVYLARYHSEPAVLKTGERYFEYAEPKVQVMGGRKFVTMDTRDLSFRDEVVLADRGIRSFHPTHVAYVLLSENIAVRFFLEHQSKKLSNPEAFGRSRQMVFDIVGSMSVGPETEPNQTLQPTAPSRRG
jgi:hypothetical protein